jgi:hypothetical protein
MHAEIMTLSTSQIEDLYGCPHLEHTQDAAIVVIQFLQHQLLVSARGDAFCMRARASKKAAFVASATSCARRGRISLSLAAVSSDVASVSAVTAFREALLPRRVVGGDGSIDRSGVPAWQGRNAQITYDDDTC